MSRDDSRREFERFVAGSADSLLRTAYLLVWDLPGAEDLVQDCLLQIARRWPRVRRMEHAPAYAKRILVNLALDGSRRRARHRAELENRVGLPVEDRPDDAAARALGSIDASSELIAAVGQLAPRQRAVVVLRYFEDLSESQVAELLGCSLGTVKSTAFKALERLRLVLAPIRPATDGMSEDSDERRSQI